MVRTVAIIGAGVSGLVSLKSCLEEGLEPTCFEQQDQLGGIWYYTESLKQNGVINMYDSLISSTSKTLNGFSDFPFPVETPPFWNYTHAHKYLTAYATQFDLQRHIVFKTQMENIYKATDHKNSGRWVVDTIGCGGDRASQVFDAVIICTGLFKGEFIPSIAGVGDFKGIISHSNHFKNGLPYKGKRVVVIGRSLSAGDVACDVSRYASKMYLSVGDGCWLLSRLGAGGLPSDMAMSRLSAVVPRAISGWKMRKRANSYVNHLNYGLHPRTLSEDPFQTPIILNEELPIKIASGAVTIVDSVIEFKNRDLILRDGKALNDIDCVIFATGYHKNEDIAKYSEQAGNSNDPGLFKLAFPLGSQHNTLAFAGMISLLDGTHWTSAEIQSRMIARIFAGRLCLPNAEKMSSDVESMNRISVRSPSTGVLKVKQLPFQDNIAEQLGVRPRFWQLLLKNPKLTLLFYCGPLSAASYRLFGPHSWAGAEQALKDIHKNIICGTQHRRVNNEKKSDHYTTKIMLCVVGVFLCILWQYICQII